MVPYSVREGPGRPKDGKRQDGGRGSSGGMKTPVGKFARKLANRACSLMASERAFAVTFAPPTISEQIIVPVAVVKNAVA